jgi:hypothetical protein
VAPHPKNEDRPHRASWLTGPLPPTRQGRSAKRGSPQRGTASWCGETRDTSNVDAIDARIMKSRSAWDIFSLDVLILCSCVQYSSHFESPLVHFIVGSPWSFWLFDREQDSLDSGAHGSYRIVSRLILSSIGRQSNMCITSCSLYSGGDLDRTHKMNTMSL